MDPKTKKRISSLASADMSLPSTVTSIKSKYTKHELYKFRLEQAAQQKQLEELVKVAEFLKAEFLEMQNAAKVAAKKDKTEQETRAQILTETMSVIQQAKRRLHHEFQKSRENENWDSYIKPENLPEPDDTPNMNFHLYQWSQMPQTEYFPLALNICQKYVKVIKKLDELIEEPLGAGENKLRLFKENREEWGARFMRTLDQATYHVIRRLEVRFNRLNYFTGDYWQETEDIKLGMWAWVDVRVKGTRPADWEPEEVKPPTVITFKQMDATVQMPLTYSDQDYIVRLMHLPLDFLTCTCPLYDVPFFPLEKNLFEETSRIFKRKLEVKEQQKDKEKAMMDTAKEKVRMAYAEVKKLERIMEIIEKSQVSLPEDGDAVHYTKPFRFTGKRRKKLIKEYEVDTVPDTKKPVITGIWQKLKLGLFEESSMRALSDLSVMLQTRSPTEQPKDTRSKNSRESLVPSASTLAKQRIDFFKTPSQQSDFSEILRFKPATPPPEEDIYSGKSPDSSDPDTLDLCFGESHHDGCLPLKALIRNALNNPEKKPPIKPNDPKGTIKQFSDEKSEWRPVNVIVGELENARNVEYCEAMSAPPPLPDMLSPRKYAILGGVYHFDIIDHVPQPFELKNHSFVQYKIGEDCITKQEFLVDYEERLEMDDENSLAYIGLEPLIQVTLPIPEVYYKRGPKLVIWDPKERFWSAARVYATKYIDDTHIASYLGASGPLAFAFRRFIELPFLKWSTLPTFGKGTLFTLCCQSMTLVFHFKDNQICLKSVTPTSNTFQPRLDIIKSLVEVYMSPPKLIHRMRSVGLDIFPERDSFAYVTPNTVKDPVLEEHCYFCLAMFSQVAEFASSQWNEEGGMNHVLFHGREARQSSEFELRFTLFNSGKDRSIVYKMNVDQDRPDKSKRDENFGFCPDLLKLMEEIYGHRGNPYTSSSPPEILGLYYFLVKTRVLSFCGTRESDLASESSSTFSTKQKRRQKKSTTK